MNRSNSMTIRSKQQGSGSSSGNKTSSRVRMTMASLRGAAQPEMSKKLYKLIKSERDCISSYEQAARDRSSIASQLSEWGEETNDDAISDLSDKLGVLMSELAEQEDAFGQNLEESRAVLKSIRNTEKSVAPSRDNKAKVADEIQKLKYKEPQSTKIPELEQELVRAEAQSLVAEAQLTNITRQKLKEAYDLHFAAHIERAEKQIMLAKQARRLLMLLDDTPVVPGDSHPAYTHTEDARQILVEAEDELRDWTPTYDPIVSNAGSLGTNAMPQATVSSPTSDVQAAAKEKLEAEGTLGGGVDATTATATAGEPEPVARVTA